MNPSGASKTSNKRGLGVPALPDSDEDDRALSPSKRKMAGLKPPQAT
jgi:hypothetical protein